MLRQVQINLWLIVSLLILIVFATSASPTDNRDGKIFFPSDETKYEGSKCETHSSSKGICRKLQDCFDNQEPVKPSDLCSFDKNDPVYCCPFDHIAETDVRFGADQPIKVDQTETPDVFAVSKSLRPIEQICEQYYPSKNIRDEKKKTTDQDSSPMPAQSHSYMASFGWKNNKNKIDWKCVGILVAEKIILTDALCINSKSSPPVFVGILDKGSRKIFNVTSIYTHPDYKPSEIYHNIAIVKIVANIPLSKSARPACIWPSINLPNTLLYRVGYTGSDMKQIFQKDVSIISNKDCSKNFGTRQELPQGITSEIFCSAGTDKCQKEIGGPVHLHLTKRDDGRSYVTGIASVGNYCSGSLPVLYTRITSYLDWIEPFLTREILLV